MDVILNKEFIKCPAPIKAGAHMIDTSKYCVFYKDHGHKTEECKHLHGMIENLNKEEKLKEFILSNPGKSHEKMPMKDEGNKPILVRVIHTLSRWCPPFSKVIEPKHPGKLASKDLTWGSQLNHTTSRAPVIDVVMITYREANIPTS